MKEKGSVLVGLSGGVDSAAVAKLLLNEGYRVKGTYLRFCASSNPERARLVALKLGIPFSVADRRRRFANRVIAPFVARYRDGLTPNPCVECNREMKIRCLLEEADRLGCDYVATGHYARVEKKENGRMALLRGRDEKKDQSYFLWRLTQKQLSRLLFPLAGREKAEIRALAGDLIPPGEKESMEICFIPDGDTRSFLEREGAACPEGDFVDESGRVLGRHKGLHCYTVGQRRGLGIAMGERYFVTRHLPKENRVVLGPESSLYTDEVLISQVRFVSCGRREAEKRELLFRGRHRGKLVPCRVNFSGDKARILLSEPVRKIAPGQSVCLYGDEELVCGGVVLPDFDSLLPQK